MLLEVLYCVIYDISLYFTIKIYIVFLLFLMNLNMVLLFVSSMEISFFKLVVWGYLVLFVIKCSVVYFFKTKVIIRVEFSDKFNLCI